MILKQQQVWTRMNFMNSQKTVGYSEFWNSGLCWQPSPLRAALVGISLHPTGMEAAVCQCGCRTPQGQDQCHIPGMARGWVVPVMKARTYLCPSSRSSLLSPLPTAQMSWAIALHLSVAIPGATVCLACKKCCGYLLVVTYIIRFIQTQCY